LRGPAPTAAELREFAAQRLMEPRLPNQWIFANNLAVNASGKIDRRQLQQMAEQYGRERT